MLVALGVACAPGGGAEARHVLIVVVDTLRADRCSLHGYDRPTTPALEALAAESIVYDDCWSPAPWTGPSHASLFTGLRPEEHGFLRSLNAFLPPGAETLAEILSAEGFATVCVASNPNVGPGRHLDQGFDRYVPAFQFTGDPEESFPDAVRVRGVEILPATEACDLALTALRGAASDGRRAFVFLNLFDPHINYDPPPETSASLVRPAPPPLEAWARGLAFPACAEPALGVRRYDPREWAVLSDLYDGEVLTSDRALERMVGRLRDEGLLDTTLLVITSDHGEMLGEDGLIEHAFHMRPELLRVPLLVRRPGGRDGGRRVADLVRLEDVFPTALEAAGVPVPTGISAISLFGDTSGRLSFAATDPPDEALAILAREHPPEAVERLRRSFRSVADGRFHYLRDDRGREWLWDLEHDPRARTSRARELPGEVRRLRALLETVHPGR